MNGNDSKWNLATVTSGDHEGRCVCVLVEFSDGWCICDMGNCRPLEIVHINDLRLWIPVKSVMIRDGKMSCDPL